MHIIVKFIDAIIVLAILLIVTLSVLNRDKFSSMLDKAPKAQSTALSTNTANNPTAEISDISNTEEDSIVQE